MVSGWQKVSYTEVKKYERGELWSRSREENEKKRRRMVANGEWRGCRRDLWNSKGLGDQ